MQEGIIDKLKRIAFGSLLLLILVGGLVMAYPNYRRGEALRRQNAELQAKIDAKKKEIAKLEDNQRRFRSDPDFVEKIARQNRRVFPGELIFIFDDE